MERALGEVAAMTARLAHRGPDDEGLANGSHWAVGMRRLAVQDLTSAGHQPMSLHRLTLVFNGEVYNFRELRKELESAGHEFRSACDAEVVLHALRQWGVGALPRFNGMFALALIDDERGTAMLARDRFGKKPLFVARLERGVAFASELKAIMAVAPAEMSIDRGALAEYFRFQYVPTPRCIFERTQKLPAGSYVEVDLRTGGISPAKSYWSLPRSHRRDRGRGRAARSADEATPREVLRVVGEAVKRRVVADVPVGAFLSGGIDSSLVVACMADAGVDVRTFAIGFEDPRYDESIHASAMARHLRAEHTDMRLSLREALEIVPTLGEVYDEPFADSSAIPTTALARLARGRVTVALSGDGGDELFGGYSRYRAARAYRLAAMLPAGVAKPLRALPASGATGRRVRMFADLATAGSDARVYREVVSVWRDRELCGLLPDAGESPAFEAAFDATAGAVERMMRCDAQTYLVDDILQKVDRASMAVGLEVRNPLLDPDVVELAMSSTSLADAAPGAKRLLTGALGLAVPERLFQRPKMGFGVPVGDWMRAGLRPMVEELVLGRADPEYDRAAAHRICREHLSGVRDRTPQLWSLVAYELWREQWLSAKREGVGRDRAA